MNNDIEDKEPASDVLERIADALDDDSFARREEQRVQREKERRFIEKRQHALEEEVDSWRRRQVSRAAGIQGDVAAYLSSAVDMMERSLKGDVRMPYVINYRERYAAFCRMQRVDELVMRIDQTIALAERVIANAGLVDVQNAIAEVVVPYHEAILQLSAVEVVKPKDDEVREELEGELSKAALEMTGQFEDRLHLVEEAVAGAFASEMPDTAGEVISIIDPDSLEKKFEDELARATVKARESVRALERASARDAAGMRLSCGEFGAFEGTVKAELQYDLDELKELAFEVRKSFETYKRAVDEGGLFAAFSDGAGVYGNCAPRYMWLPESPFGCLEDEDPKDDELGDEIVVAAKIGKRANSKIKGQEVLTNVKESGAKGDSLPCAIERMKEFNSVPYWGMLDDGFAKHIDWFWYGFRKLMQLVNTMFEPDFSELALYHGKIRIELAKQAHVLGLMIDEHQFEEFDKELKQLQKTLDKQGRRNGAHRR